MVEPDEDGKFIIIGKSSVINPSLYRQQTSHVPI